MSSGDEVSVSVGQMVMMKTEDEGDPGDPDDPDDPNKNQVILQLQPITGNEAETDAAVMTVESQAETPCLEGDDVEIGYPITCGDSKALLLAKKFVCPGINVKCVKVDDQLISPKQFVHMSGKATLKDWKRAIRMGGVMLRKMMDSGQLDFYHHTSLCTNTCRSTKFDLLINNTRFPPDGTGTETTPTPVVAAQTDAGSMEWSSTAPLEAAEKKDACDISEETLSFWKGIADVGLMGEVVTNISTELLQLLTGVQLRTEQSAAQDSECLVEVAVLSNLAQVFGLLDSVKKILERRKLQINLPGQEDFLSTLTNLEEQLEEQERQQQVRAVLSSNPQPQVVNKNKPTANRRPQTKRPRLQRPASTTALLGQQAALQPQQQFTVLSPISLSSMGQSFTSMGQSFTSMGQTYTLVQQPQVFTLHPSSGLTLVDPTMTSMTLVDPMMTSMELVQGQVMDGTVLLHQEVMSEGQTEAGQTEHTVIQIDPAPMGGGGGVKEESEGVELHQDGLEVTVEEEAEGRGGQEEELQEENVLHTEEEVQGLTLDASGHISGVQIVVMEESSLVPNP